MANIEHKNATDANIHVCKGIGAASAGAIIVADGAGSQGVTSTSSVPVNLYDNELRRPILKDYGEKVNTLGNITTTQTIDLTLGNVVTATLTGNTTLTFSNPSPTGNLCSFTFIVTQDGTGSRLLTYPGTVKWEGGTEPVLSTAASAIDILGFMSTDAGTTWYGFLGGLSFS